MDEAPVDEDAGRADTRAIAAAGPYVLASVQTARSPCRVRSPNSWRCCAPSSVTYADAGTQADEVAEDFCELHLRHCGCFGHDLMLLLLLVRCLLFLLRFGGY